jgi:hypothetical protein
MAANVSVVLEGVLKADDTIELASHPALRPGPVRVRLEPMRGGRHEPVRDSLGAVSPIVIEEPMLDPWVELPQPSGGTCVRAKLGKLPLPDPPVIPDDDGKT